MYIALVYDKLKCLCIFVKGSMFLSNIKLSWNMVNLLYFRGIPIFADSIEPRN